MNDIAARSGKPDQLHFTLDGRPLVATSKHMQAEDVLRLGGLDPAAYDLVQVRPGNAPDKPYGDDRQVVIKDGDQFLSVRQSAQVA